MQPVIIDPRWALLTLVLTALFGLTLWLVLMVLIESRKVSKKAKRISSVVAFVVFLLWLFTLGDPHSRVNLEVLYYKSINHLPQMEFTKYLQKAIPTNSVLRQTNAPATVQTNK